MNDLREQANKFVAERFPAWQNSSNDKEPLLLAYGHLKELLVAFAMVVAEEETSEPTIRYR